MYDSSGHRIEGNLISGLTNNPLLDSDGGIELEASSDNQLFNDFLSDTVDADYNQVLDNVPHLSGGAAIGLGNAHHNLSAGNDVRFNPGGIELGGESGHNRLENNDASYSSAGGISVEGGEGKEIIGNVANNTNANGTTPPYPTILTQPANGSSTLETAVFTFTGSDNNAPATALRFECRLDAPPDPALEPPEPGEPPQPPDVDNWFECASPCQLRLPAGW